MPSEAALCLNDDARPRIGRLSPEAQRYGEQRYSESRRTLLVMPRILSGLTAGETLSGVSLRTGRLHQLSDCPGVGVDQFSGPGRLGNYAAAQTPAIHPSVDR
jgi:hypothetical protein